LSKAGVKFFSFSGGFGWSQKQLEMLAELFHSAVERFDRAVRTRDHDAAFHDRENIGRESVGVSAFGETMFDLVDTLAHRIDPAPEVFGDELVCGPVFGVDFESKATEGAAIAAFSLENAVAITGEYGKDALDGLVGLGEGRVDDHWAQCMDVALKNFAEKSLFAFEEMIEAAGVHVGVGEKVGHAGASEASLPEEVACGVDEAIAGGESCGHVEKVLDRISIRRIYLNDQPSELNE
jgi:hypothetical protein